MKSEFEDQYFILGLIAGCIVGVVLMVIIILTTQIPKEFVTDPEPFEIRQSKYQCHEVSRLGWVNNERG